MAAEPRYLLMTLVADDPGGFRSWAAVEVAGVGRVLTRAQAEAVTARNPGGPRFLLPYSEHRDLRFAREGRTLGMPLGEGVWNYGEPTRADMIAVVRTAAGRPIPGGGVPSPDPNGFPLLVSTVLKVAAEWFGPADPHEVETSFDGLMMELGSNRHSDPPCYSVPLGVLGLA